MRLSTTRDRDETRAIAVLHAALDAGVTFLDTADAYCLDHTDIGHNERLIARALATWPGDRSRIVVATKGGLTRPNGQWVADGRAKHLTAACDASRRALGVERIPLYQLHAPDPRTPLETSVRALAALKRAGAVERIGLCNVSRGQIEAARRITDIDSVQVELSVYHDQSILSGVVAWCASHVVQLIAHRPLGGAEKQRRLHRDPLLIELARRHGVEPHDIALAWLLDLDPVVLPIPGPTRVETATRVARAWSLQLTDEDRARLDARVPAAASVRARAAATPVKATSPAAGELVLVMGLPAAGKSTLARALVDSGYTRLNRDEDRGSLQGVVARLESAIAAGATRIVVDNTYVTRQSRATILRTARRLGLRVRGRWLTTSVEDAQTNAVWRMLSKYGRLLDPEAMREASKRDPGVIGPGVVFRYQRQLEPPEMAEGFDSIDHVPFVRAAPTSSSRRALIVWADGVLRRSRSGWRTPRSLDDLEVPTQHGDMLRRFADDGWTPIALGWRPEISEGTMTAGDATAIDQRMSELLGVAIESYACPHSAGPPICWCRKPLPGLAVMMVLRHGLDPYRCLYVGSGPQDPGFARRLGFQYADAAEVFGPLQTTRRSSDHRGTPK